MGMVAVKLREKSLERGFSTGAEDKRIYKDYGTDEPGGSMENPSDEGISQPGRTKNYPYTKDLRTHIPNMPAVPYDEDRDWAKRRPLKKPKDI